MDAYRKALSANFVEDCISGSYVSEVKMPEHTVRGTLSISCLSSTGNVYEVSYQIDELTAAGNVQQTRNIHREAWLGFFDSRVRQLVEMNLDKSVSFLPEQRRAVYQSKVMNKGIL
jgi:hypothetical protein